MKRFARLGGIAVCAVLVAGSVYAARTKLVITEVFFPGVDSDGNIDWDELEALGGEGSVRVTYNSRNGRLRAVGRANVENLDKKRAVFNDEGIILDYVDGDVVRDRYTVSKKGAARYVAVVKDAELLE